MMKYVVVKNPHGWENIYVFPKLLGHNEFVRNYFGSEDCVVSAGFVEYQELENDAILQCTGESITLRKKSRTQDTILLKLSLKLE